MYLKILEEIKEQAYLSNRDPNNITLIAITKSRKIEEVKNLLNQGCKDFGESRVQEFLSKYHELPNDTRWHFIGSLQKNKVPKVLGKCHLIHSLDSLELAQTISKKSEKKTSVLLQVNTSLEATKHGLYANEWDRVLPEVLDLEGIEVKGLMTIGPNTDDVGKIRDSFKLLNELSHKWQHYYSDRASFSELSMGMSKDFKIAIQEGATLLRIGSALFI